MKVEDLSEEAKAEYESLSDEEKQLQSSPYQLEQQKIQAEATNGLSDEDVQLFYELNRKINEVHSNNMGSFNRVSDNYVRLATYSTERDLSIYNATDALGLSAEEIEEIESLLKFFESVEESQNKRKKRGRPNKKEDAHQWIPRLATITAKEYACALSTDIGGVAYVTKLDEEFFKQTRFDETDGSLTLKDRPDIKIPLQDLRTSKDIKSLDYTLLRSIYTILYQQKEEAEFQGNFIIDEMELARFLGIQINKGNAYPLLAKLNQFNSVAGVINGSIYALLHLNSYNKDTGKINLYSGFMGILTQAIKASNKRTKKIKGVEKTYENPSHSFLMHSNVGAKCKNTNGILLAEQIIILLQQAGEKVNPHIKISTLIDRVPILRQKLDETPLRQSNNNTLKNAFTAMYRVLKNNTDVYGYFIDLNLPEFIPTVSVLDTVLTIAHKGINKDYKTPQSI